LRPAARTSTKNSIQPAGCAFGNQRLDVSGEVHIRASWIFTKHDALANLGTVIGGVLVSLTKTALPDLILGLIICAVVVRGGIEIVRDARSSASREAISEES